MPEPCPPEFNLACPLPRVDRASVQLAHGGGGRLMRALIESTFLPAFGSGKSVPHDSAVLDLAGVRIAFTTDTYVVSPIFFPGGDIGKLAVYGTANDLAMAGAKPAYLSAGFVLEEGFPMETLERVVASMRIAAAEVGVKIVTGDTKVVDRGKGDGIYINTAGVGLVPPGVEISPARVRPGDSVLVSGDLGRHGIAIMSVREGLRFEGALASDCASLAGAVEALVEAGVEIHCLRDLTRGGLASALNEIAMDGKVGIELDEASIAVAEPVAGACELLGLDPLYVANEGRLVAFVPAAAADRALAILRGCPVASQAAVAGRVVDSHLGVVQLRGQLGGTRIVDLLSGEQMPRIC
ncbi:MAG: hydrogenase expression/formation protein HypE [Pirellulales bacterium]